MPPKYQKKRSSTWNKVTKFVRKNATARNLSRVVRVVKDVAYLKSMINAEKKRLDIVSNSSLALGQVNANASGQYTMDITPIAPENDTFSGRSGSSIKLHSSYMKFQFWQMSSGVNPTKGMIYLVQVKGAPQTPATFAGNMFMPNQWISLQNSVPLLDINSELNPDYFGTYRILKKQRFYVKQDSLGNQHIPVNVTIPMKYYRGKGHHIRFTGDSNTVVDGQLVMIILVDNGNASITGASSLVGIPVQSGATGLYFQYDIKHYYYDN